MESEQEILDRAGQLWNQRTLHTWHVEKDNTALMNSAAEYLTSRPDLEKVDLIYRRVKRINNSLFDRYVYLAESIKEAKEHYNGHKKVYQSQALTEAREAGVEINGWEEPETEVSSLGRVGVKEAQSSTLGDAQN